MKDEEFDETKPVIKLLHILSRYSNEQSLAILSIALKVELHQCRSRSGPEGWQLSGRYDGGVAL